MSRDAATVPAGIGYFEQLRFARQVILQESQALAKVADRLDASFCRAAEYIYHCRGSVIVSGMGKAGLIGQKIMATLASTGSPSHFLHPAEALHGDLGRICSRDVMLILSQSGETEEILRLLPPLAELGVPIIAITGRAQSTLGRAAAVTLDIGPLDEACSLGLAPTTTTTAMLAVGDALALVTSRMRNFTREDFARFHPAGSLGLKLSKVDDHLRPVARCRVALETMTVRDVFASVSVPGRRTGAIMLVSEDGRLTGIFTDSDLARLFERRRDRELDQPIRQVMTAHPVTIASGSMMIEAVKLMSLRKISELPVVDSAGRPVGLIDITDVLGLFPNEPEPVRTDRFTPEVGLPACRVVYEPDDAGAT